MTIENPERLRVLSAFLRSQAALTDTNPTRFGAGEVKLNHEEALAVADAIDSLLEIWEQDDGELDE